VTIVSSTRLIGAPIFIFLFASPVPFEHAASLPFLLLLFLTDILDGFLARRWMVTTDFGYVLDGVADRSAHIAVVVALVACRDLSPLLGFLLIFRDLLLYAARALFVTWWTSNGQFRKQVKVAAVLFKLTVGGIALMSYVREVAPRVMSSQLQQASVEWLRLATWIFAAWSYVLLAQQIHKYVVASADSRQAG
jgi:phosphatidylglycerophosphate synthase